MRQWVFIVPIAVLCFVLGYQSHFLTAHAQTINPSPVYPSPPDTRAARDAFGYIQLIRVRLAGLDAAAKTLEDRMARVEARLNHADPYGQRAWSGP